MTVSRLGLEPDELIYSWFARHAYAAGNRRLKGECRPDLKILSPGTRGLPFGLAALLHSHTDSGPDQKLALAHSQLGYLTAFKPPVLRHLAVQEALATAPNWPRLLGSRILRSVSHKLRHCRDCDCESLEDNGFTYWRVAHQLPCAWVCTVHATLLHEEVDSEAQGSWLLPGDHLSARVCVDLSHQALSSALRISVFAKAISDWTNPYAMPPEDVNELLRRRVTQRSGSQSAISTRRLILELADALQQLLIGLPRTREIGTIADSPIRLQDQIQPLFDSRCCTTGPLIRHLLLAALFGSWEEVRAAMSPSTPTSPSGRLRGRPRTRQVRSAGLPEQAALWDNLALPPA